MMEHDPSRIPSDNQSTSRAARLRGAFSRERFAAFADRLGLARLRRVPGIGWVIAVAAIALFIQGVGLANLVAVNEEKQQWNAAAGYRQTLEAEIRDLEAKHLAAKQQLHTLKSSINDEAGRLAEKQASLARIEQLRDQAQREQGAASNDAARLREANETIAAKSNDLAARLSTTETRVQQLEQDRDRLTAEVIAAKKLLDDHRAEAARAAAHAGDLETAAAATLEAIRQSREAQIKAQADLDAALAQVAKANAELEAVKTKLQTSTEQAALLTADIARWTQQQAALKAAIATEKKLADELAATRIAGETELAALREQLDKAGKLLAQKQGAAAGEEAILTATQTRHDAIKARIANLQAELKPLEEQRLSMDAEIAGKRKELETLRERIEAGRAELKALPGATQNKPAQPETAPAQPPAAPDAAAPAPDVVPQPE